MSRSCAATDRLEARVSQNGSDSVRPGAQGGGHQDDHRREQQGEGQALPSAQRPHRQLGPAGAPVLPGVPPVEAGAHVEHLERGVRVEPDLEEEHGVRGHADDAHRPAPRLRLTVRSTERTPATVPTTSRALTRRSISWTRSAIEPALAHVIH